MHGCLVMVVGPSGSGKDTLLDRARERLGTDPAFRFVRRIITRPAGVGEAHEPVTPQEVERRADAGEFAIHWNAHGLRYGMPAEVLEWIQAGSVVVANGSRAVVASVRERTVPVQVVSITAPPAVLAERLAARGRETTSGIGERLARAPTWAADDCPLYEIDNCGTPAEGGDALIRILLSIRETNTQR